jgi:outer membrane protein OmpA-like peptidoglycan-associated protein
MAQAGHSLMKRLPYLPIILLLWLGCNSCVGVKKYKALETQNQKITATLLETKEELSIAKRDLNKLEDRSSSNQEALDASITVLQKNLQKSQSKLKARENQINSLKKQASEQQKQLNKQLSNYEKELKPYQKATKALQSDQNALAQLQTKIDALLAEDSLAQLSTQLYPCSLVVTFEHRYLFGGSERAVSNSGRKKLEAIAQIMQQYSAVSLDILGHTAQSSDALGAWKNSTRKPLVVLYALLKAGAPPKQLRIVAYSQYAPLIEGNSPEAATRNARTELVFHYNGERFLPTLLQP